MAAPACTDCGGAMAPGFMVDKSYGMEEVSSWQEGQPEKRWWTLGGIAQGDSMRLEVTTYRCERCGLLKSYAA